MTDRPPEPLRVSNYELTGNGIFLIKESRNRDGTTRTENMQLTNFAAFITGDVRVDDGAEVRRVYEMAARLNGRSVRFRIPAERFAAMNWPSEQLGSNAIVRAGMGTKDHARAAIQYLSGEVPECRVFAHTGWRQLPGGWGYLTASGAMMSDGLDETVTVDLGPALSGYELPTVGDLRAAIAASLNILDITSDRVTVPLLGAAYRAPLPLLPDCSVWLYGESGTYKTALSALAQQHYGSGLSAYSLPGNWTSTANMLEMQAFTLAGALFTVDDYSPDVSSMEARRRASAADRLLRASANHSGRGRLMSDASMRPARPPRAQVLTTAEDLPPAVASIRARVMVAEVARDAVRLDRLTTAQQAADAGTLAMAMSGYVQWLAPRYAFLRETLRPRLAGYRDAARAGGHPRAALNIASLALGWDHWLFYAEEAGVIDAAGRGQLWQRVWNALCDVAADQARYQRDASPVDAYLRVLGALLSSGKAHLASFAGDGPPPGMLRWGWRVREFNAATGRGESYNPCGECIGWTDDTEVYLDPEAAYKAARQFAEQGGAPLGVSKYALQQQLNARHLLSMTEGPGRLTVRRNVGGRTRNVLHLNATSFAADDIGPE